MEKVIIDAEKTIFGRLCSYAAKQAIQGKEVIIINSEKAVITGNKNDVIKRYNVLRSKGGHSQKGPKRSKSTYMMLKRGIRGMIPNHREGFGKQVIERIKCYDGVPKEFEGVKALKLNISPSRDKYIELKELSERI